LIDNIAMLCIEKLRSIDRYWWGWAGSFRFDSARREFLA
jgi:hypothetical protein